MNMKKRNVDIVSDLSDPLIHLIFSFLDTREVVQTSVLSKRWKYLWMSNPFLNFYLPENDLPTWPLDRDLEYKLKKLLQRVLIVPHTPNLHKLCLNMEKEMNPSEVQTWLNAALRRNVQEIYLQSGFWDSFQFTDKLFMSDLKVLNLNCFGCDPEVEICTPSSMCSASKIKCLQLYSVKLPEGNSKGELVLSCPHLENLKATFCDISHLKTLTISAPLLENLELMDSDRDAQCDINICSQKLKSLKCKGSFRSDYILQNLSALLSADIDIAFEGNKKRCAQRLIKVLDGVCSIRVLTLPMWLVKGIAGSSNIMKWLPDQFPNLRCIKLTEMWADDTSTRAIVKLLEKLPHIATFIWERDPGRRSPSCRDKGKGLGSSSSSPCEFVFLKTIEIRNSKGFENELKFIDFLLQRAKNMKEVKISTNVSRKGKHMVGFIEKLMSLL